MRKSYRKDSSFQGNTSIYSVKTYNLVSYTLPSMILSYLEVIFLYQIDDIITYLIVNEIQSNLIKIFI